MTLRFSDKPQLIYGGNQGSVSNLWQRFPQGAQPIATAPERQRCARISCAHRIADCPRKRIRLACRVL